MAARLIDSTDSMSEPDRLGRRISLREWQIYVNVWLVCLIFPILAVAQMHPAPLHLIVVATGLAIFIAFYVGYMRPYPIQMVEDTDFRRSRPLLAIILITLLILALCAAYGSTFLWLLIGTSAVAGKTLSARRAHLVATVLPLLAVVTGVALSGGLAGADWQHLIPLALLIRALGLDMIGLSLLSGTIRELHAAREELAHRAVIEERLRLARDLHDLLGHTLSLIVLKSELAGRLIERKPAQAAHEIQELETVARQALREVRQAVAGYRQPTLDAELDGARQLLEAAGIACVINAEVGELPPIMDSVLAWTVREGVTNVIRHSRARVCTIHITSDPISVQVEVTNDGCGGQETTPIPHGSGLSGLAERVRTQGGQIEASPYQTPENQGFRLLVTLPVAKPNEVKE